MLTKQDIIDLIPRIVWIIHISLIIYFHYRIKEKIAFQKNVFLFITALFFLIMGTYLWASSGLIVIRFRNRFSPTKVFKEGPYKYIRHPMYVGIYSTIFGSAILFEIKTAIFVSVVFIPVWVLLSIIEEIEMTRRFNKEYVEYKKQTGIFFPKIRISLLKHVFPFLNKK